MRLRAHIGKESGLRKTSVNVGTLPVGLWEVFDTVRNLDITTTLLCALWILVWAAGGTPFRKHSKRSALACTLSTLQAAESQQSANVLGITPGVDLCGWLPCHPQDTDSYF